MASAQSEIFFLREQIDKGCAEKLALEHEVCVLRGNLEGRDKNVEQLRPAISHQSDHYNDLWSTPGTSLKEV